MGGISSLLGGGGGMSGMSSGSIGSSSAANYNTTDSRASEAGAEGEGNIVYSVGDGSTLNDLGVVREAFSFVNAVDAGQKDLINTVLSKSIGAIQDSYSGNAQSILDAKTADSKYLVIGALAVVVIVGLVAFRGK